MSTSTMHSALHTALGHSEKGTTTDGLNERNALILKIMGVLETYDSSELIILKDESRSQQGKLEALKKLATDETSPSLKWLRRVIEALQTKDENFRTRFFTIDSGITNIVERMAILAYLWNRLDVLDSNGRNVRFLRAAEKDEIVVLSAMLTNPWGVMVGEDLKQRALTERARRLFPQPFASFEQNQILLEFLTMIRDWLGRWLGLELRVEIPVLRENLGNEVADFLTVQTRTGLPQPDTQPQLTGVST